MWFVNKWPPRARPPGQNLRVTPHKFFQEWIIKKSPKILTS